MAFTPYGPIDPRTTRYRGAFDPTKTWNIGDADTGNPPDLGQGGPQYASALSPNLSGTRQGPSILPALQSQYQDAASRLQAIQPPQSTGRAILGALVSRRNPQLGDIISGQYQYQRALAPLVRDFSIAGNQLTQERELENQAYVNQAKAAEAAKNYAEAAGGPAKQALENAQALAARYKEDPGSGQLIDLQTKQPVNSSALAPLSAEEAQVLGKNEGDRVPVKLKNTANEIVNRGYTTVNTEEGVFEKQRGNPTMTRLGNNPREISLDTPVGALDNTTGKQVMVTKKDIVANPGRYAPVSADVNTPVIKQTLKEYGSTKPGTAGGTIIANNTAIAHLGLLSDAVDGLGNNNLKIANSVLQKYNEQTGSTVGATFDTVKQAVSGELAKVTGSLSQGEQEAIKGPLDKSNSPQALKAAIRSAVQIMDGKMGALHDHYVSVMGEEPDSPLMSPEAQKVRDKLLGANGAKTSKEIHYKVVNGQLTAQ